MKRIVLSVFILTLTGSAYLLRVQQAANAAQDAREEFHQTYPLSANGRVSLSNIAGTIRVIAWERNEVKVDAVKTAYKPERLAEARIEVEASADALRIKTKYPDGNRNFYSGGRNREDSAATVEYTLSVPQGATLNSIQSVSGDIVIENVAGEVTAASVSGEVTARGLRSTGKLTSVSGTVEMTVTDAVTPTSLTLSSVSGAAQLTLPSDANADVRGSSVSGTVRNEFNLPVRVGNYVGRDFAGRLGTGALRVRLDSVSGTVILRRANDGKTPQLVTNLAPGRDSDLSPAEAEDAQHDFAEAQKEFQEAQQSFLAAQQAWAAAQRSPNAEVRRAAQEEFRAVQEAWDEAQRGLQEAQRELQNAHRDAQREAARAQADAAREQADAAREQANEARAQADEARASRTRDNYGPRLTERDERVFPVTGTPTLNLRTDDGSVTVRAWDESSVKVIFIKQGREQADLSRFKLTAQQNGNDVDIRAELDKSANNRRDGWYGNGSVNLEIYVPRQVKKLTAQTGDGRVTLEGITGELKISTGDGAVEVNQSGGRLDAQTGDGRVNINDFNGAARITTGDGRISLAGKFTALEAQTGDGSITFIYPPDLNAVIEAAGGRIVADDAPANITEVAEKNRRRVTLGSGGPVFKLQTGDGRIYLQRAGS